MNKEEDNGDADAGIGHVKGRPRVQKRGHVPAEIEQEKIDHVPVKKTIGQIAEHAGEQKRERNIAPGIWHPASYEEGDDK